MTVINIYYNYNLLCIFAHSLDTSLGTIVQLLINANIQLANHMTTTQCRHGLYA